MFSASENNPELYSLPGEVHTDLILVSKSTRLPLLVPVRRVSETSASSSSLDNAQHQKIIGDRPRFCGMETVVCPRLFPDCFIPELIAIGHSSLNIDVEETFQALCRDHCRAPLGWHVWFIGYHGTNAASDFLQSFLEQLVYRGVRPVQIDVPGTPVPLLRIEATISQFDPQATFFVTLFAAVDSTVGICHATLIGACHGTGEVFVFRHVAVHLLGLSHFDLFLK